MVYQHSHAAAAAFGEAQHLFELRLPVLCLPRIRIAPCSMPLGHVAVEIHGSSAVCRELFERFREDFGIHIQIEAQLIRSLWIGLELACNAIEYCKLGIVALIEEIVR